MKITYKKPETTTIPLQMQMMLSESNVIPPGGNNEPTATREHRNDRDWEEDWD